MADSPSEDAPFHPGEIADGEVRRVNRDDDGDATVIVAVDGETYTVRESQEDGANIAVEDGTRVMHHITEVDVEDRVTVRRVDASSVTLHGYQTDIVVDDAHAAIEDEEHVQVFEFTDNGHAYGIGTEGKLKGEIVFLGPLTCPRNTHIAATPMDASVRADTVAVCTDPAFWSDAYLYELARVADLPRGRLESMRLDLEVETHNDTATPPENNSVSTQGDDAADAGSAQIPSESNGTPSQPTNPDLTEDNKSFTSTRRRQRDQAFAQEVKDAYDERCAVCGTRRVAPNGGLEVEAAHIYPKSEDGVDDVRNGVALCKLHHWAFDNGWLSVTDDYEVIVRQAEGCDGYDEFNNLNGESLHLPNDENLRPHPKFLNKHRSLHGFEE
ncbi:HNH endonuclease [Halosegnis longus]|uniref:HNH endonuclease n=1 Tax=Halosegnis longus TaxID=2216012 RepID=UPI0015628D1D|nr:HNH endonuclease [Halosegnis longus]